MSDVLKAIDAAIAANLCGCGCGTQIPDNGPSADFVNATHQQTWHDNNQTSTPPPPPNIRCDEPGCTETHRWNVRITSIGITTIPQQSGAKAALLRAINRIRGTAR